MAVTSVVKKHGDGQFRSFFENLAGYSGTVDFASMAAGAADEQTMTCPGVALGDVVLACSLSIDQETIQIDAYVSAANTVTLLGGNAHASTAKDLDSATVRLVVGRFTF